MSPVDREPLQDVPPNDLEARQSRLEQQIAELSLKLDALERNLAPASTLSTPPAVFTPPPPTLPPPKLRPPTLRPQRTTIPRADAPGPNHPPPRASLENRLGSQVFNRVGIIALLFGATWFLKLAVDNQWIGAGGRVLIGLLAGAGLVLWSERFRRRGFPAFSYSLKAIGSGVLYLALWASFQLYHLLPASVALLSMLLVTAWNAYMAWAQDAELLAAYALAGGLSTPLLLSTGGNHETFLFTYLLGIDLACVTLSRLRSWPRLLAAALPATVAYFIGWYTSFYAPAALGRTTLFLLLFFGAFTAAVFGRARQHPTASHPQFHRARLILHILLPIANAAFLALALYSVLQDSGHHDLLPWLMVALSAVYLGLLRVPQPPVTAAVHLSLAIVFFTIAIPLKANGPSITIAWLAEGVALLWVSTRMSSPAPYPAPSEVLEPAPSLAVSPALGPGRVLRILASAALLLGFGGILKELFSQSLFAHTQFFNRAFATALAGLTAFALATAIAYRARHTQPSAWPSLLEVAAGVLIAFNLTAVLAGLVQINSLGVYGAQGAGAALARALAVSAFLMLYGAALLAAGFWQRIAFIRWQALILLVVTIAKTFLYDIRDLSQGYRVLSFLGLGALLMAISFSYGKDLLSLRDPANIAHPDPPPEPQPDPQANPHFSQGPAE